MPHIHLAPRRKPCLSLLRHLNFLSPFASGHFSAELRNRQAIRQAIPMCYIKRNTIFCYWTEVRLWPRPAVETICSGKCLKAGREYQFERKEGKSRYLGWGLGFPAWGLATCSTSTATAGPYVLFLRGQVSLRAVYIRITSYCSCV